MWNGPGFDVSGPAGPFGRGWRARRDTPGCAVSARFAWDFAPLTAPPGAVLSGRRRSPRLADEARLRATLYPGRRRGFRSGLRMRTGPAAASREQEQEPNWRRPCTGPRAAARRRRDP